jgi:putative phosphoesterase
MKLAVIADIHANLPALQAILADLPSVDGILCCGDLVGYYLDPDAVCETMLTLGAQVVRGNHDGYVAGALTPEPKHAALYRTTWTREALSPLHLRWLGSLPIEAKFACDGVELILRHASPWDEETYLRPGSEALDRVQLESGQVLMVGHTHLPLWQQRGCGWILNPGSAGQPRDWDPRAAYAVIDTANLTVNHRRVVYDVVKLQERLRLAGVDSSVVEILSRRR